LIRRCLDKQPKKRWQAIGDVRAEIETIAVAPVGAAHPLLLRSQRPLWRRATPAVLSAVAASALIGSALRYFQPASGVPPVTRFAFALPEGQRLQNLNRSVAALSADGSQIVYETDGRLNLRSMNSLEVRTIHGVSTQVERHGTPVFSPDGGSVVHWSDRDQTLKKIATSGGSPITLCAASNPAGMSWRGQEIFLGQPQGIMRVSSNGGTPVVVVPAKPGE
jgi:hypothetical protein